MSDFKGFLLKNSSGETLDKYIQDYLKKQKEKQLQEEENNKKLRFQKYF